MTHQATIVVVSLGLTQMKMDIVTVKISMNVISTMEAVPIDVTIMKAGTCANVQIGEISVSPMMGKHANLYAHGILFISVASAGISRAKQTIGMPKQVARLLILSWPT